MMLIASLQGYYIPTSHTVHIDNMEIHVEKAKSLTVSIKEEKKVGRQKTTQFLIQKTHGKKTSDVV